MPLSQPLNGLQSPDNSTRKAAEEHLADVVASDPSNTVMALIQTAESSSDVATRQSALLYLKKVVPMYWSAGFESFKGPPVSQVHKHAIRNSLLNLVTGDSDSKIRNTAAYAVVQIAAVDYPDEWPDLLQTLYHHMVSLDPVAVLGGLSLLQDLMDDLVTEEQFFGGVGNAVISQCMKLMASGSVNEEIKSSAANLYKSCLLQLQNPDILEDDLKRQGLENHFSEVVTMLTVLLRDTTTEIQGIVFRTALYGIAYTLSTEFPEELFDQNAKLAIQKETVKNIIHLGSYYSQIVIYEDGDLPNTTDIDTATVLEDALIEQYQLLGAFQDIELLPTLTSDAFLKTLIITGSLPLEQESEYAEEYDLFVTEESGVSPNFTVRNATTQLLSELTKGDTQKIFTWLLDQLDHPNNWRWLESVLLSLSGLLETEVELTSGPSLVDLLNKLLSLSEHSNVFVRSRAVMLLPLFVDKFKAELGGEVAPKSLLHCLRLANNDSTDLFKAAFLLALLQYSSLLQFNELEHDTQHTILNIIASLVPSAKEDTPPLLAESLTIALKIQHASVDALKLLLKIAAKEPGNIQLVIDIEDAFEELMIDIDFETYLTFLQIVLPSVLPTLVQTEYSGELALSLQVLNIFIYNSPADFPPELFSQINDGLSQLLLATSDDQILQLGGEVLNSLIGHSSAGMFNVLRVLEILSKFLSPELSDSAALNVGSLVVSVITKFSNDLETILPEILKATTQRLLQAKELATVEDLLGVLCYMISIDVNQTIQFLGNFEIEKIFNIWFSNFGSISGTDKIRDNCKALAQIYLAQPNFPFMVNGEEIVDLKSDVIITRSMRRRAQFKQVSVPFMIIKVLVHELRDQCSQKDFTLENLPDAVGDDNEDGWEDLNDIGEDFDKLKSYIHEDRGKSDDLRQFLIDFFKEAASKDINNFRDIYGNLSDSERQTLTECII